MFIKRTILVFASVCVSALLAEGAVRLVRHENAVNFYATDPATGLTVMLSGVTGEQTRECYTNVVTTNSRGWRDSESAVSNPDGAYRIAVLGDSYVAGFEVPLEKTFHYRLEEMLNQGSSSRRYEVLSFGKGGNGLYYDYRYLKDYAAEYRPDLVLVLSFKNDVTDDLNERFDGSRGLLSFDDHGAIVDRTMRQQSALKESVVRLLRKSALARFLYEQLVLRRAETGVDASGHMTLPPDALSEGLTLERKILSEMRREADKITAKLVVASVPDREQIESPVAFPYVENLASVARDLDVPFIDLTGTFQERAASGQRYDFPCDPHWNEVGHAWAAEALLAGLRETNMLPAAL